MNIVMIKKDTVLVEMSKDEIKNITDKTIYESDLIRLCKENTYIPIGSWSKIFSKNSSREIKSAITSLDAASKFLNNQFEELLKVEKQ